MRVNDRIIHIGLDEKFIDAAYLQFEAAFPKQNQFFIALKKKEEPLKHVTNQDGICVVSRSELISISENLQTKQLLVLHSLPQVFYDLVLALPKAVKVVWLCYGFEVYNNPVFFSLKSLLAPLTYTKRELVKVPEIINRRYRFFQRLMPKTFRSASYKRFITQQAVFKRVNYLGTSFQEEFDSVVQLTAHTFEFVTYWHYPLEHIVNINQGLEPNQDTLLIGNSAAASNNHLDVINLLKHRGISGIDKVCVPLNYGDNGLGFVVDKEAQVVFGAKYFPIKSFLPIQDYNSILKTCRVAIFYNKRQQSIGTTIALLWYGARVYLSVYNPFYRYLKRIGVVIFSVEEDLMDTDFNELLARDTITNNRNILLTQLGQEKLVNELQMTLNNILY